MIGETLNARIPQWSPSQDEQTWKRLIERFLFAIKTRVEEALVVTLSHLGADVLAHLTYLTTEVSVGSIPRRAGTFTIAGSGMTPGKAVIIQQAAAAITGKGTRSDENEMDTITVTARVESASVIRCYWTAASYVVGNFKFDYQVSV